MSRIVFDITQMVEHLKRNPRLTGIQRVEFNVVTLAGQRLGAERALALYRCGRRKSTILVSLSAILDLAGNTPSPDQLVRNVLALSGGYWPDAQILRMHLDRYKNRKITRILKKISILIQALINRNALIEAGLLPPSRTSSMQHPISSNNMMASDIYVNMGAGWNDLNGSDIALKHQQQGGKTVQMIHDMIPMVHPQLHMSWVSHSFKKWLSRISPFTTQFLCVSHNTARDLEKFLRNEGKPSNITVTPLAHEFLGFARGTMVTLPPDSSPEIRSLANKVFVLCVGSIEIRKNCLRLVEAWISLGEKVENATLVFCGRRAWGIKDFNAAVSLAAVAGLQIEIIEDASDIELAWLYSHCRFSVYPSLYEGWGLPVGESMWFHAPCLASSASSMPQVGGGFVEYCDPGDVHSIAKGIESLFDIEKNAAQRRALHAAPLRSWQDLANDVVTALTSIEANQA
jgi:glycosyltransferase involved in cell wall biosynthesis